PVHPAVHEPLQMRAVDRGTSVPARDPATTAQRAFLRCRPSDTKPEPAVAAIHLLLPEYPIRTFRPDICLSVKAVPALETPSKAKPFPRFLQLPRISLASATGF